MTWHLKIKNMKKIIIIMAISILGANAFAQNKNNTNIVLVHGAWSDGSAWNTVIPFLKAKGYNVTVVNLPGHGNDGTPFSEITLQSYVDVVKKAIGDNEQVTLVGHSMAGIVISRVAEEIPNNIKGLVYLAAYLPKNGQSLLDLAKMDAGSHVGKHLKIDEKSASAIIAKEGVIDVFFADAPADTQQKLADGVKPDPLMPFVTPVTLTEGNYGVVEKIYIYTTNDHAVSYPAQQAMVKNTKVKKEYILESSHTPFISMPKKVAKILIKATK